MGARSGFERRLQPGHRSRFGDGRRARRTLDPSPRRRLRMDTLSGLLRGQVPGNIGDLVNQFNQGQHEQVADRQVTDGYSQVAAQLPPDEYRQSAEEAFSNLSPDD